LFEEPKLSFTLEEKTSMSGQTNNAEDLKPRIGRSSGNGSASQIAGESLSIDAAQSGVSAPAVGKKHSPSRASRATGPRTTPGKERSKHNALKHGIFSKLVLLKDEPSAGFDALLKGLRKDLQPEGTLEDVLVEKLGVLLWRQRRLVIAETAEIRKAVEFLGWDEDQRQTERANDISEYSIHYEGGLIHRIANPTILEECLELLKELKEVIKERGFDTESDSSILTKLYGVASSEKWQRTLFDSYQTWLATAECSEDERQQHGYATPEECKNNFLEELGEEIKRLERYKKTRAAIESERMKLEALRRSVPDSPQLDRLLRYEASLERAFDRTLIQLERLQRMRLGQSVLPPIKVDIT
jgi:hypothetical protein